MAITDEIPKSRITLTYRTTVKGEPEEVTLPFRVLVMGNLSNNTSKDAALPLDQRQIRKLDGKNLNHVMKDMSMSLTFSVENKINPRTGNGSFDVTLPVTSMKSFLPAEVANQVPRVKALLLLKKLLLEAQSKFDNRKEFRDLLRSAVTTAGTIDAIKDELKRFEPYKLPAAVLKINVDAATSALPGLEIKRRHIVVDPTAKVPPADAKTDPAKVQKLANEIYGEDIKVEPAAFNQEMRVKAGKHEIRAFAPGKKPWSKIVVVPHDDKTEIAIGPFDADAAPIPPSNPAPGGTQ